MRKYLPHDPERMNDERAEWANQSIAQFQGTTNTDREDVLCDLLANLMHWCDRNEFDFNVELERAREHYAEETAAPYVEIADGNAT